MTATLIDGKAFAARLREDVAGEVAKMQAAHGVTPGLAVVLVGDDAASAVYVRNKGEQAKAAGMHSVTHRLPAETTEAELLKLVGSSTPTPPSTGFWCSCPCRRASTPTG